LTARPNPLDHPLAASALAFLATAFYLFPLYWMFVTSIKPERELLRSPPTLFPDEPTFEAYVDTWRTAPELLGYFANSVVIATGTMALTLLLAAPMAYALARRRIRGCDTLILLLLVVQMIPTIMLALPYFIAFSRYGLLNTYQGLILANTTNALPFAVLVLRPYFLAIPQELEDAALMDNCNRFQAFARIVLPLVKPGLVTVGAFCFLFAWGDFIFALILAKDPAVRPITLGLFNFVNEYGIQWDNMMAVSMLATLPVVILFVALQRHLVGGLAQGAVKG